jgi:coatomer protein complex subunit epsilon
MATLVYTYLQMDRMDLAEKQFKTMQQNEDDATLTNLASAWVNLAKVSAPLACQCATTL